MHAFIVIFLLAISVTSHAQVVVTGEGGVITIELTGETTMYTYKPPQSVKTVEPDRKARRVVYRVGRLPQFVVNEEQRRYRELRDYHRFVLQPYLDSLPDEVHVLH